MTVDRIESLDRQKSKVFVDGDFAFVLYAGELKKFGIEEGKSLEPSIYEEAASVVYVRAREKALRLLETRSRTEWEIRRKLRAAFCGEKTEEAVIAFLKEYGFLDDRKYIQNYIEIYGKKKSRAELIQGLCRKGISRSLAGEFCRETDSREAIEKLLQKRGYTASDCSREEREKVAAYLLRRGFSWEDIRACLCEI